MRYRERDERRCIDWHRRCLLCHRLYRRHDGATAAVQLCGQCWQLVQQNRLKEMVHATEDGRVHCSYYHYINEARDLLWHYKFNAIKSIGVLYSHEAGKEWARRFHECALVPIPASIESVKRRGWDQIAEIAKVLAAVRHIVVLPLIQRIGTQATKQLNRARRLSAVHTQYKLSDNFQQYSGVAYPVVLFDDVYTTGATIAACTDLLQQHGVNVRGSLTMYRCA